MTRQKILTQLTQYHDAIDYFDYSHVIEWALNLVEQGNIHDDILMLASFSEPINKFEIKPYINRALKAVGLNEKTNIDNGETILGWLYVNEILENRSIRKNLSFLESLYLTSGYEVKFNAFYSLSYAWMDFDYGQSYSYEYREVTIDTIEDFIKKEAKLYIENYINPIL
ncbi:hypothetical protein [Flavobacterium sp. MK4S-17]|uniref:hypothetical protein n=1 Tax=Flavobacterium sp. MK4S-17 TaxID=2543737 RepID=UPI001356DB39|nr:hypothetical protein [Flavobacterium sp. MK4S-17]